MSLTLLFMLCKLVMIFNRYSQKVRLLTTLLTVLWKFMLDFGISMHDRMILAQVLNFSELLTTLYGFFVNSCRWTTC